MISPLKPLVAVPDDIFIDPPCALWPVGVDSPPERITIWPELPVSLVPDTNDNDPPFPATLDAPAFIRMLPVLLPVLDPVEIVYFSLRHLYPEWFTIKWPKHPLVSRNQK